MRPKQNEEKSEATVDHRYHQIELNTLDDVQRKYAVGWSVNAFESLNLFRGLEALFHQQPLDSNRDEQEYSCNNIHKDVQSGLVVRQVQEWCNVMSTITIYLLPYFFFRVRITKNLVNV